MKPHMMAALGAGALMAAASVSSPAPRLANWNRGKPKRDAAKKRKRKLAHASKRKNRR